MTTPVTYPLSDEKIAIMQKTFVDLLNELKKDYLDAKTDATQALSLINEDANQDEVKASYLKGTQEILQAIDANLKHLESVEEQIPAHIKHIKKMVNADQIRGFLVQIFKYLDQEVSLTVDQIEQIVQNIMRFTQTESPSVGQEEPDPTSGSAQQASNESAAPNQTDAIAQPSEVEIMTEHLKILLEICRNSNFKSIKKEDVILLTRSQFYNVLAKIRQRKPLTTNEKQTIIKWIPYLKELEKKMEDLLVKIHAREYRVLEYLISQVAVYIKMLKSAK